ncbi:hypothetical protein AMECASPLE_003796 [Ameca splendens]|uniref:Uncharacterized protein n=1 Tax=Ameca splendens TaxID=208324 RepID=A0ABV0YKQ7_9TELE
MVSLWIPGGSLAFVGAVLVWALAGQEGASWGAGPQWGIHAGALASNPSSLTWAWRSTMQCSPSAIVGPVLHLNFNALDTPRAWGGTPPPWWCADFAGARAMTKRGEAPSGGRLLPEVCWVC